MIEAGYETSCRAASVGDASGQVETATVTSGTATSRAVSSSSGTLTQTEPLTESLAFGAESAVTLDLGSLPSVARTCNEAADFVRTFTKTAPAVRTCNEAVTSC